ncbi:MAG: protein kinase [Enhygromyxa sp.]
MDGQASSDTVELHEFAADRFEDLCTLGEGQNARVYSAWDRELERGVAIKVAIEDTLIEDLGAEDIEAFGLTDFIDKLEADRGPKASYTLLREARLLAKVDVPGVVAVHEIGYFRNRAIAVVMPLLRSIGLSHTAPWRDLLNGILHLGEGLAALHQVGIVHRDLKPDNILYDDAKRPIIADLGLACQLDDEETMGHFAGTYAWMAPELILGGRASMLSDLFSFCMVGFQMFYGHPPFADDEAKLTGQVSEIQRAEELPPKVREVLLRGLRPKPQERWSSMPELLEALREPLRPKQPKRRTPWLVAAGLSVAAAVGVGMCITLPEARADVCDEVSRELVDFWNADVQTELRVILGTRRASDRLQSVASRWVEVRAHECELARRDSRPDRASPCSVSVRDHLNATVATLRTPYQREGLDYEVLLAGLPSPEHCLEHPEDGEYGNGGLLELRRLDIEVGALLASGELEIAARRQSDYMLAAREISAKYDIARAIHWRAELHRLRAELDDAEADFKRAYAEAIGLRALEFSGEAMLKLVTIAGSKGEFGLLDERAFVARTVFAQRRPDKVAELVQVQGLALAEGDPEQRDRGLALLRDAVDMREAQHSHYGGTREKIGWAMEALARGLLAAEQADEAVTFAKQSLAIHELEYSSTTNRAHELRRLLFVAQVNASLLDGAQQTLGLLRDTLYENKEFASYLEETLWAVDVCASAGRQDLATSLLVRAQRVAATHGLTEAQLRAETLLRKLSGEP